MKGLLLLPILALGSCGWNAAGSTGCQPVGEPHPLPEALRESSGVAWSLAQPGVLWSHNDGGHDAELFAIDLEGNLLGTIRLRDIDNRDWEDMATGPCEAGFCVYVADTGDNYARWDELLLYRMVDNGSFEDGERDADVFHMTLPDGPRDVESLFVLPGEEVFLVTKGRHDAVTLYRYPGPLRSDETVTLEAIQTFSDGAIPLPSQITGADASPDGSVVALRTYHNLTFYRWDGGQLVPVEGGQVELRTLQEPQGEAVGLGPDGQVVLTTEAGNFGGVAALRVLRCGGGG